MDYIKSIKIIEVNQPIGTFYIGSMKSSDLLKVANKNLSRYKDLERGLQRDRSPAQIKSIKKYVERDDASFPNTIIINVGYDENSNPNWIFNEVTNELSIKNGDDVVNVIDGQHRLFGLEEATEFELPVSIFLGLPFPEQGMIFATINSNQRSVDASLVYELFGLSSKRLEETVSYKIVSTLNSDKESPWFGKIKMLGKAKNDGDISQGSFSKFIHKNLIDKNKVMRSLYEKEKDEVVYRILLEFFNSVRKTFPVQWENKDGSYILTKTTGFNAFMLFLIDLIKLSRNMDISLNEKFFLVKLNLCKEAFDGTEKDFLNSNYPAGGIGQSDIRRMLRQALTDKEKDLIGIKK